jgi:hypothetical protein
VNAKLSYIAIQIIAIFQALMWRMCFSVPENRHYGYESHSIILKFSLKESISMAGKVRIPDASL